MSMGLYNEKQHVAQLWGCHDLHTANWESLLKRTTLADVCIQLEQEFD